MKLGPLGLFCGLSLLVTLAHSADRYFTWVDENGQVHSTAIKDDGNQKENLNPLEQRAEEVRNAREEEAASPQGDAGSATGSADKTAAGEAVQGQESSPERVQDQPAASSETLSPDSDVRPRNSGQALSLPRPDSAQEGPPTVKRMAGPSGSSHPPGSEHTSADGKTEPSSDAEFNLNRYPDSRELARHGYVRDPSERPYFTWRDAQGQLRVSYYEPKGDQADIASQTSTNGEAYTEATVLKPGGNLALPEGADPDVARVMGLQRTPSVFAKLVGNCCAEVPKGDIADLPGDRNYLLKVDSEALKYAFRTGESPYRLVRLPSLKGPVDLKLKSFVHNGVFIPTLAFLDDKFQVTRLVTDLAFTYEPEKWYRYGFLEARLPLYPEQGEKWVLIFTRKQDVDNITLLDDGRNQAPIKHTRRGTLDLELAKARGR